MKVSVLLRLIPRASIIVRTLAKAGALLFLCASLQSVVAAQDAAGSGDDRETVKQLLKRVEELKPLLKRVEELEAEVRELKAERARNNSPAGEAAKPVKDAPAKEPESHADDGQAAHAAHERSHINAPLLEIRGYGDVYYRASNLKGETNTFGLGELDLFITSRLSDNLSVLAEPVLAAGRNNTFSFKLERLLLQYSVNDYFNVGVGRFHTAIGYYNTAYHHGTWFQTATGRPFIFAGEGGGGVLPIHNVGVTASGRIPSGRLGLRYVAEIGNGRKYSSSEEQVQSAVDENNGKAGNFALLARPDWVPGLQAGISVYRDKLTPRGLPNVGQTITAAHVVYQTRSFELLNEALVLRHSLKGRADTFNTAGFYTQVSRQFGKARPYFRYQYINTPVGDPIFSQIGRRNGPSYGLRYEVGEFAALKAQYDHTARRRLSSIDALTLQLAFTF